MDRGCSLASVTTQIAGVLREKLSECLHRSVGKEPAYNAGDPGSIPRLGRFAGEGIGYPLQYSSASLVAQLVKNLSAVWETWV